MSYAIVLVQKRQLTAVALLLTMKSSLGTRLQIDSHSAVMERSMEASFPKKRLLSQSRWCSRWWKEIVHMHSGCKFLKKSHFTIFIKSVLFHNIAHLTYVGVQSWKAAHLPTLEIRVEQGGIVPVGFELLALKLRLLIEHFSWRPQRPWRPASLGLKPALSWGVKAACKDSTS